MTATGLTVEVSATVRVRQKVDVVALFTGMAEHDRKRYRTLDLAELGMSREWERPAAFLWPEEDDLVPLSLVSGAQTPVWGDIDMTEVRLQQRGGNSVHGREAEWTEGDFETLTAQVPWLRDFHASLTKRLTPEELARIPGPDDVPLF